MENYRGNQKGFIYVSFDDRDQKEVIGKYLEPLSESGIKFCWGGGFNRREDRNIEKSHAVLLFLNGDFSRSDKLRKTAEAATKHDKPILSVYTEDFELDSALSMLLDSQQALFVDRYKSDDEFMEDLKTAAIFDSIKVTPLQKKQQSNGVKIAVAAIIAAALIASFVLYPDLKKRNDPVNSEISTGDIESVTELCVVGKTPIGLDKNNLYGKVEVKGKGGGSDLISWIEKHLFWDGEPDYSLGNTEEVAHPDLWARYEDSEDGPDTSRIYYEYYHNDIEDRGETEAGDITDLSAVSQMKNLKVLILAGQQIEDITPLLELENLEYLSLSCNPVTSLDGLEKLPNLRGLDISYTNVSELPEGLRLRELHAGATELDRIPDFRGMSDVQFSADSITDVSNIGTAASYQDIGFNCENVPANQILEGLEGIPVENLNFGNIDIDSLEEMSGINTEKMRSFSVNGSSLTSLDGIEHFEGIEELGLGGCEQLTDLSAVNNLKSLKKLYLSQDMEWMKDSVDERIDVIVEE